MGPFILGVLLTTRSKAMVSINGQMEGYTQVNGNKIRLTVKAFILGLMVDDMKVNT